MQDNIQKLNEFILNIDGEIEKLGLENSDDNIFNILRIEKLEIRHSNFLAWLLDLNQGHALGNEVLKTLMKRLYDSNKITDVTTFYRLENYIVERERDNIDILIISRQEKVIICIENKIESEEHDNQLNRYREIVRKNYPEKEGYKHLFIYLDAKREQPSDKKNWIAIDYEDIYSILEEILKKEDKVSDNIKYLIECYIEMLKNNNYAKSDEFKKICQEIYDTYKEAWNIIQENSLDGIDKIKRMIKDYLQEQEERGQVIIRNKNRNIDPTYIEFYTPRMKGKFNTEHIYWQIWTKKQDHQIEVILWTDQYSNLEDNEIKKIKTAWKTYIKSNISEKDRSSTSLSKIDIDDCVEEKISNILDKIINYEWEKNFEKLKLDIRKIK